MKAFDRPYELRRLLQKETCPLLGRIWRIDDAKHDCEIIIRNRYPPLLQKILELLCKEYILMKSSLVEENVPLDMILFERPLQSGGRFGSDARQTPGSLRRRRR